MASGGADRKIGNNAVGMSASASSESLKRRIEDALELARPGVPLVLLKRLQFLMIIKVVA